MKWAAQFTKDEVLKYQSDLNSDNNRKMATYSRELRRIEDIVHLKNITPNSKTVLCAGARDDSEVQTFINKGYDAIGIDVCIETELIKKLDISELTPEFGSFDIIYCSHVLEHVMDPIKTMKAIKSVCNDTIFIILPIIDRPPDIEHPTVYEIMKYEPETNFKDYPQAWDDFVTLTPSRITYNCYRNGSTDDYEVAFAIQLR